MSYPAWISEFEASAITPELALANVRWVEGPQAVEEFLEATIAQRQRVGSYITAGNARLIERYQHLEAGGWIAYGVGLDGSPGQVPYLKPAQARRDAERDRTIKYETPPGAEARPLLPIMLGQTWADVLANPQQPVVWAEGLKTALAPIEQGYPAIALRGITQWHQKGSPNLWPELAQIAAGRVALVAFDVDGAAKTRAEVARQAQAMGNAIERAGGVARFITWPAALGKGLDDVLAALPPEQRRAWLDNAAAQALTPEQFRRRASIETARSILVTPGPWAERFTTGEYLPQLPSLTPGAVHWVDANMGSGKTYRMGRDWVRPWAEAGGITVVLSPLNSLGQQTAKDWRLPHIHDYKPDTESQQILQGEIDAWGGLVACENSAHRVLSLIPKDRPLLLVIDETAQVLTDAAEGGTLQSEWAARWEDAITLMQRAATGGAIALAEAGIDADTIALVKTLSGAAQTVGIRHRRRSAPWLVHLHRATPLSGWRAQLLERLQAGDRILYVATSQAEGRRLEQAAIALGVATHRIDSQTNEGGLYRDFFEAPEAWLYRFQPQLVILSPSGKTGLSIEGGITAEGAYFDSVWGYFPALDTDTAMQLLGRYRPPVPRHIWAPAYVAPAPGEGPRRGGILGGLAKEASLYATYGKFEQAPADAQDSAIKQYLAARRQRRWAQKIQFADALADALGAAGHQVEVVATGDKSEAIAAQWAQITERLAQEDSAYHAGLVVDPETHTLEWAAKTARGVDTTREQRCRAAKVRMMARFPGINWDSPEIWYQAVFCPRRDVSGQGPSSGPLAPGAALWAEAEHYRALWEGDAKEAAQILSQRLKAAHLLPQSGPRAMLAAVFRPLLEVLWRRGEITPGSDTEAKIKAIALRHRAELAKYWRLNVDESQSETAIANKIARKFGFVISQARKIRHQGRQAWTYAIAAPDLWVALVAARDAVLRSTGRNSLNTSINESLPPPTPSGSGRGGAAPPVGAQGAESPPSAPGFAPPPATTQAA